MIDLREETSHYLDASELASATPQTSVAKALKKLVGRKHQAIVIWQGQRPHWLMNGNVLASHAIESGAGETFDLPLRQFLPGGRREVPDLAYPVAAEAIPLNMEATARDALPMHLPEDQWTLYPVVEAGKVTAFFFSNEPFKDHATTPPPEYVCRRGHVNSDPDHGRCGKCPARLIDAQRPS